MRSRRSGTPRPSARTNGASPRNCFGGSQERYAPRGLAHFGQGKWYPGRALPRWSLNCFWRKDGEPLWSDRALVADETRRLSATPRRMRRASCASIAERLGVSPAHVFPAYEDAIYYLWRERKLPVNVDPLGCETDRCTRAGASGAPLRAHAGRCGGLCAAARPTDRGCAVAKRRVVLAPRPMLFDSGRFAARLSLAARFAALGRARRLSARASAGPDAGVCGARALRAFSGADAREGRRVRTRRPRRAGSIARTIRGQRRSNLHLRRGARRCPLHLHAPDAHPR